MSEDRAANNGRHAIVDTFDIAAFGFGPSNLSLAIAAAETAPNASVLFIEEKPRFSWHSGMMLPGSKMQISFLKDLVTLRNPSSRFTFLRYLKERGRLEQFVNLREFYPSRIEYSDYLSWVAEHFRDKVRYGSKVRRVRLGAEHDTSDTSVFELEIVDTATSSVGKIRAKNLVYACGGKPYLPIPKPETSTRVMHSDRFLPDFADRFPSSALPYVFAVVGDGQSAGEIVSHLLDAYPQSTVHMVLSGYAPRPADSSPFVNEIFFSNQTDMLYEADGCKQQAVLSTLRNTNYGVMDDELIEQIYRRAYSSRIHGRSRLIMHQFGRLTSAEDRGDSVQLEICSLGASENEKISCDAVVLATGYRRQIDDEIFADVLPLLKKNEAGNVALTRNYRAETLEPLECALFVQGYGERSHGIGDSLLSLLPFRSKEIVDDIFGASAPMDRGKVFSISGEYPPQRHLERDEEHLYAVMQAFRFATLVSVSADGELHITHVPLTLDRSRGTRGVLFGHMDRSNPHVDCIHERPIRVIFHGPNRYISPHVYESDQLPTWNSIAVHVSGTVRIIEDAESVVRGLMGICEHEDPAHGAYRLDAGDPRIPLLIDYIVGFEIDIHEMVGRFKLSQDRNPSDRELAAREFLQGVPLRHANVIANILGLRPIAEPAELSLQTLPASER